MSEEKIKRKSFILYTDTYPLIKSLSNEQAGIFVKNIFLYKADEKLLEMDAQVQMAFDYVKNYLDIDNDKWQEIRQKRVDAGQQGGLAKAEKQKLANANNEKQKLAKASNSKQNKQTQANLAVNVSVNDNVTVNESDNVVVSDSVVTGSEIKKRYGKNQRVTLTESKYQYLCNKYSKKFTDLEIDGLDKYIADHNGKGFDDCDNRIERWLIDRYTQEQIQEQKDIENKLNRLEQKAQGLLEKGDN